MVKWRCDTELYLGHGSARQLAETFGDSKALVLVDPAVAEGPARPIIEILESRGAVIESVNPAVSSLGEVRRFSPGSGRGHIGSVWGIGGGSVLDVAKLVRAGLSARSGWWKALSSPGRSGFVATGGADVHLVPLVALPTTLGTGAEVSPVACFDGPTGKRLSLGPSLIPTMGALDSDLTESLPISLQRDSVAEIACRLIGPYLAGKSRLAAADEALIRLLGRLKDLDGVLDQETGLDSGQRLELAIVGAETRTGLALVGREMFASKLWYLSTSLADVGGCSKVDANRRVLRALTSRIETGDSVFGDRHQFHRLLDSLAADSLDTAFSSIGEESDRDRRPPVTAGIVARHAQETWGRGLPMLGSMSLACLADLYQSALPRSVLERKLADA